MVTSIDCKQLQRLIETADARVVDVLPEAEYGDAHIPGAVNIPLRQLTTETVTVLRRDKPVVVY
jgi:rhodanese-related sulfurtransferase